MKKENLERAARLTRALANWSVIDAVLRKAKGRQGNEIGLCIDVGQIENDHGELVQPDADAVVDRATGKLITAAARKIIETELRKLGVKI